MLVYNPKYDLDVDELYNSSSELSWIPFEDESVNSILSSDDSDWLTVSSSSSNKSENRNYLHKTIYEPTVQPKCIYMFNPLEPKHIEVVEETSSTDSSSITLEDLSSLTASYSQTPSE